MVPAASRLITARTDLADGCWVEYMCEPSCNVSSAPFHTNVSCLQRKYALKMIELSNGSFRSIRTRAISSMTPTPIPSLMFSAAKQTTHSAAPGEGRVESMCEPRSSESLSVIFPEGGFLAEIFKITLAIPA